MVRFVILCVSEFQIVRMSCFSLVFFEELILVPSFSCSCFSVFSFLYYFSLKMCSAMVFGGPSLICKIPPQEICRLS